MPPGTKPDHHTRGKSWDHSISPMVLYCFSTKCVLDCKCHAPARLKSVTLLKIQKHSEHAIAKLHMAYFWGVYKCIPKFIMVFVIFSQLSFYSLIISVIFILGTTILLTRFFYIINIWPEMVCKHVEKSTGNKIFSLSKQVNVCCLRTQSTKLTHICLRWNTFATKIKDV